MDKRRLKQYKMYKKRLKLAEKRLDRLYARALDIPMVQGKVTASSKEFPYIASHVTVQMDEPVESDKIGSQIRDEKKKKEALLANIKEVEDFISKIPDGEAKDICELHYLEEISQADIADTMGYSQGRISQIIRDCLKD